VRALTKIVDTKETKISFQYLLLPENISLKDFKIYQIKPKKATGKTIKIK